MTSNVIQTAAAGGYRPELDGLRAVAIVCVVLFHAYPQWLPGGLVGVDVFFVLSGYLITQWLIRHKTTSLRAVGQFYGRRLQRLYPPLLLFLAAMLLAAHGLYSTIQYSALLAYALSAVSFSTNFYLAVDQSVLSDAHAHNPFLHLWSLGIEMQFYVVWAGVVAWALRRHKVWPCLLILLLGSLVSIGVCYALGWDQWLFYAPITRLAALLVGAAAAYGHWRLPAGWGWWGGGVAVGLLVGALWGINPYAPYPNAWTLLGIAAALWVVVGPKQGLNRFLGSKPVVYVGRISYSWYLWHWGLMALYAEQWPMAYLVGASFLIAGFSYAYIERPLQRRRRQA